MPLVVATAALLDEDFLTAFADCSLPLTHFRHGDHLRYAWLQVHRHALEDALCIVRAGIRRFAEHHGAAHIFHETMTQAWVRLVATHREPTFAGFLETNQDRLTGDLLHRFWTPETLNSSAARSGWLPPDRAPLPTECGRSLYA